jgi:hypothetical protein
MACIGPEMPCQNKWLPRIRVLLSHQDAKAGYAIISMTQMKIAAVIAASRIINQSGAFTSLLCWTDEESLDVFDEIGS